RLHKGYDRFQSLLSQLETYSAGVFTGDANQKFLRVFESDVKGSTGSFSSTHNVAFVSSDNTSSTNEVNTAYGISTSSGHNLQKEGSSSYTNDIMYSFFANQSSGPQLDHEDLEQDEHKAMVTIDGEGVDWTGHAKDDIEDYALMAFNSSNSGSDTEMSAKDKSGLGYGSQIQDEVFSYENKVFASVFDSRSSDVEGIHVNNRFAIVVGKRAVSPPMTGNYMHPKSEFGIDESKFTYGPKQSTTSESDAKTTDLDSCDTSSSKETLKIVPKPVKSKPKVVNEPKVWSDAPIIEEYKSDSDDEYDNPHQTFNGKGIVDSGCSRHMTGNKAYLVDYQDFNGGPVAFGGSKGQITVSTACYVLNMVLVTKPLNKTPYELLTGKFEEKSDEGFLVGYYLSSKAFRPITVENKANKTAGQKETNNNAGTQDSFDAKNSKMAADHAQEYYVLPLWSSYTSTVKSSKVNNGDDKLNEDIDSKTNEELVDQEDQDFLEELERLKRQEKEVNDAAETLRKTFAQSTKDLLLQVGAARASSTNYQFWTSAKVKTVNDKVWIQALVDGKMVRILQKSQDKSQNWTRTNIEWKEYTKARILSSKVQQSQPTYGLLEVLNLDLVNIMESFIRRTLRLDDAKGTSCLTNIEIFEGFAKMRYILLSLVKNIEAGVPFFIFPRFVQLLINHQLGDMAHHKEIFETPSLTKKVFANMKRVGTRFSREVTPLFDNMLVQAPEKVEKVLSMMDVDEKEPTDVEEVLEVVKVAKLMTEVVTTAGATKIEEPKPLKRQAQIKLDKEVARQLEAELNADINWNAVIEQVKRNERLNDAVMKYQTLKRKPLTQDQARKNMIVYLKNMAGFKMDYFKGMTYDEIRPLFERHYNFNQTFLDEINEGVKVLKTKLRQEKDVEVESSKREDATPLASKIPIVDYKIHTERNRPHFKIIRADRNHMGGLLGIIDFHKLLLLVQLSAADEDLVLLLEITAGEEERRRQY
nr:hypothetical protein [Tanacetum cinerariifolium]